MIYLNTVTNTISSWFHSLLQGLGVAYPDESGDAPEKGDVRSGNYS